MQVTSRLWDLILLDTDKNDENRNTGDKVIMGKFDTQASVLGIYIIHAGSAVSKMSSFSYRGHTSGLTKKKWRPEDNISPAKK